MAIDPEPTTPAAPPAAPPPSNQFVTVLTACGVVATALATLGGLLNWFGWTDGQWIVTGATTGAFLGLVISVIAHLRPGTQKEPVAIGASVTALATSLAALGGAFAWWTPAPDVQAAVVGLVTAVVGLLSAVVVRGNATPTSAPG